MVVGEDSITHADSGNPWTALRHGAHGFVPYYGHRGSIASLYFFKVGSAKAAAAESDQYLAVGGLGDWLFDHRETRFPYQR